MYYFFMQMRVCVHMHTDILEHGKHSSEKPSSKRLNTSDLEYYTNQHLCPADTVADPLLDLS